MEIIREIRQGSITDPTLVDDPLPVPPTQPTFYATAPNPRAQLTEAKTAKWAPYASPIKVMSREAKTYQLSIGQKWGNCVHGPPESHQIISLLAPADLILHTAGLSDSPANTSLNMQFGRAHVAEKSDSLSCISRNFYHFQKFLHYTN
jgi:hypothetical protein